MRDALSMLDQCVSNGEGTIDESLVRQLLGLVGRDWLFTLAHAVCVGDGDVIIQSVDDIIRLGKEPRVILTELCVTYELSCCIKRHQSRIRWQPMPIR